MTQHIKDNQGDKFCIFSLRHATGQTLPIQLRVSKASSKTTLTIPFQTNRLPTYVGYGSGNMKKALEAVLGGRMSVRKAAEEHDVPRSTLHGRITGKVAPNARSGAKRYLSDEEEAALVDFLIGCASVDCAKSCKDVMALIQQIVSARDSKVEVTRGWWDSFHAGHSEVTLRHAEPLSYPRAAASSPDIINRYFDLLEDVIKVNGLSKHPSQIYNCTETGMLLSHTPPKVIAQVGQKHPYSITSGDRSPWTMGRSLPSKHTG